MKQTPRKSQQDNSLPGFSVFNVSSNDPEFVRAYPAQALTEPCRYPLSILPGEKTNYATQCENLKAWHECLTENMAEHVHHHPGDKRMARLLSLAQGLGVRR